MLRIAGNKKQNKMILTDKAKEDFREWLYLEYGIKPKFHDEIEDRLLISYIIEWLDSVEIYITIKPLVLSGMLLFKIFVNGRTIKNIYFDTRKEATEQSIINANERYNKRCE